MSNNKSRRPSAERLDVGDVTERNPIPQGLRYPPPAMPATIAPQKVAKDTMNRRPKATPAPIEEKSNIIPFSRPHQPVAMVVSNPKPVVGKTTLPLGSKPILDVPPPTRAAVMVSQPQSHQPVATAVFQQQANGSFSAAVAVNVNPQSMTQIQTTPHSVFPATQFPPAPMSAPSTEIIPAPAHSPAAPEQKWATYDKLGLGQAALQKVHKGTSKLVVSAYRLLGFGILTLIVTLLVGYIAESIFYFVSDSWVQPMIVSAGDEKIVQLQSQLAEQRNNRDKIQTDLTQAEKTLEVQQAFQAEYVKAIKADMSSRNAALARMRGIAHQYASARGAITGTNQAYASAAAAKLEKEYQAGLVDQHAMMAGNFQSAQITTANLGLAEREIDMEQKADDLAQQTSSLEAILDGKDSQGLSYEVLKIKQDYENSKLEEAKAIATRDALKAQLTRQDEIVKNLESSSYMKAVHDKAQVAFVPYGNMKGVKPGVNLYGCKLGMVICHKVGKVLEVLPGEIQQKHPHRDKMLRGELVEIQLDDDSTSAQDDVLFVGGKPLGL
jgi:hypothetical protein